jgi:hypothetical protein
MRGILVFGALLLASCGGNAPTNNAVVAEESESADSTLANDTTAIDAATGESADMAADVNYTFNEGSTNETDTDTRSSNKSAPAFEPDEPGVANNSAD